MFNPSNYISTTPTLYGFIQGYNAPSDKPLFYLLTDSTKYQNVVFGFPYIPGQFKFTNKAKYKKITRSLGTSEDLQYLSNETEGIEISGIMMDTRGEERTFQPIVDFMKELMLDQKENPSYFSICIGERVLYPYVMADLDVKEEGWSTDGLPVTGTLNLKFIKAQQQGVDDIPQYRTLEDFTFDEAKSEILKKREELDAQLTS